MISESPFDLRHVRFEGTALSSARRGGRPSVPAFGDVAPAPAPSTVDAFHDPFPAWVLDKAGLDASSYRGAPLQRRVPACLRALRVRSVAEARERLRKRPDLVGDAVSSLLIGVTEFRRDAYVFDALSSVVLPALAERRGALRVWSAGCSTGEELYSVATQLAEAGILDRTELLGTDCRADAIEQAAAAGYQDSGLAAMPTRTRLRYFESIGGGRLRPIAALRARANWKVSDLLRQVEPGPWDMILWRNAAIYLNREPAARVFTRLIEHLSPGGFLVVGKAERPPATADIAFICRCIYRKGVKAHG